MRSNHIAHTIFHSPSHLLMTFSQQLREIILHNISHRRGTIMFLDLLKFSFSKFPVFIFSQRAKCK